MVMALSPHGRESALPALALALALPSAPRLVVHGIDDPRRTEVETFIRQVFARRYGADVRRFAPTLVSVQDQDEIVAAAGYRCAADETLFLERYLPAPVESLLAFQHDDGPARRSIVEVGHLAAARPGAGRHLIGLIGSHLAEQDFSWVVCTLTLGLRQLFTRIGVAPLALGVADPALLGADVGHWGSYYDHRPIVLAGQLGKALRSLAPSASFPKGLQ